jgi:hypothetical protein
MKLDIFPDIERQHHVCLPDFHILKPRVEDDSLTFLNEAPLIAVPRIRCRLLRPSDKIGPIQDRVANLCDKIDHAISGHWPQLLKINIIRGIF